VGAPWVAFFVSTISLRASGQPVDPREPPEPAAVPAVEAPAQEPAARVPAEAQRRSADQDEEIEDSRDEERGRQGDDFASGEDSYDPLVHSHQAIFARRAITGGAILLASGSLLLSGSLALGLSDPCAKAAGNSCSVQARRRGVLTMALPGVGAVAAGVALLWVGSIARKKLRASISGDATAVMLQLSGRL
jgi:hypothetical protein